MLTLDEQEREAYQRGNMELAGVLAELADREFADDCMRNEIDELSSEVDDLEAKLESEKEDTRILKNGISDLIPVDMRKATKQELITALQAIDKLTAE